MKARNVGVFPRNSMLSALKRQIEQIIRLALVLFDSSAALLSQSKCWSSVRER
ncbi:MAG: hypothetical protein AAF601_01240 [Pseudomonadota bacterium]